MVLSVPQVDLHQSSVFLSQNLINHIVIVPSNNVQSATVTIILYPQAIGGWKWSSFMVSSPSRFTSPGFTPTHAPLLLLLDLQSYLTFATVMYQVYTFAVTTISRPFPLSVSTFHFLHLQLPPPFLNPVTIMIVLC